MFMAQEGLLLTPIKAKYCEPDNGIGVENKGTREALESKNEDENNKPISRITSIKEPRVS